MVVITLLWWVCLLFLVALWTGAILSFISITPGSPLETLNRVVNKVTDPVLRPVRRILPPARIGGTGLDLSPLVVSIVIIIIMNLLL